MSARNLHEDFDACTYPCTWLEKENRSGRTAMLICELENFGVWAETSKLVTQSSRDWEQSAFCAASSSDLHETANPKSAVHYHVCRAHLDSLLAGCCGTSRQQRMACAQLRFSFSNQVQGYVHASKSS